MTLIELQDILGERIAIAANMKASIAERERETEISQTISSLAKQMINNADVVLRAEKLLAQGSLQDSSIARMIKREGTGSQNDEE